MSYLEDRLKQLGITPETNAVTVEDYDGRHQTRHFFTEDNDGNIIIHYCDVRGVIEYYDKNGKLQEFTRTRYNPSNNQPNRYGQDYGSKTHVFCTPVILDLYKRKQKTKDLYLTEGEFKAFALNQHGIPCFAFGGINSIKNEKKTKLNDDILDFIRECKVENVFMVYDADCFKCEWEDGKDMHTRANNFCCSVGALAELLKPYNVNFYMCHIHGDFMQSYKGIDDLLFSDNKTIDPAKVIEELQRYSEGTDIKSGVTDRKYIITYLISGQSRYFIQNIFATENAQDFYDKYKENLINKDWVFKGVTYYADESGKVHEKRQERKDTPANYVIIENDFRRFTHKPGGRTMLNVLEKVNKNIITVGMTDREAKQFISRIPKYNIFTNEPENDPDKYKQVYEYKDKQGRITTAWNEYEKLDIRPAPGSCEVTLKFLKHIFSDKNLNGECLYEFGLDYLKLLYENPRQKTPILCLCSEDQASGKSTLFYLLQLIYKSNAVIIDSRELASDFNELFAGKFIVCVDESDTPSDKKEVSNAIKLMTTADTITKTGKGVSSTTITNHTHLLMATNKIYDFLKITKFDNRFCLCKVPPLTEEDPDLLEKIKKEIPAFLYYLKKRPMYYERKTRTYFDYELYKTELFVKVVETNENPVESAIKSILIDQFYLQGTETIEMAAGTLAGLVQEQKRVKNVSEKTVVGYLGVRWDCKAENTRRQWFYYSTETAEPAPIYKTGRRYIIPAEKVLNSKELENLRIKINGDKETENQQPTEYQTEFEY